MTESTEAEPQKTSFKIESIDDIRRVIVAASGGDPEAQQTLNAFLKFNNVIERTNLPTRKDVILVAYLEGCGRFFYPVARDNPFETLADCLATAFMAKGGDKSKQFVELMKQTPSLAELQTFGTPAQPSWKERILGKKKAE